MEGVTKRNTFFYGQADPKGGMGGSSLTLTVSLTLICFFGDTFPIMHPDKNSVGLSIIWKRGRA